MAPTTSLVERVRVWVEQTVSYWRGTATPADFVRLMRVRLALSKLGPLVCRHPLIMRVNIPALGGDVWLRSHTTDIGVLTEQLATNTYRALEHVADARVIVDLGANTGLVARWLLERYPDARIVCVEPECENVELLRRNLAAFESRAVVVPKCVGSHEGTTSLETDSGEWGFAMTDGPGDVEVTTMARLVDEHGLERIDLLKCDIEGAERDLFASCSEWIWRVGFALVECHDFPGEELLEPGWRITQRHGWAALGIETVALAPESELVPEREFHATRPAISVVPTSGTPGL
jgi:FkbM family methyltransferase